MKGCENGIGCFQDAQCQECLASFNCYSNLTNISHAYCPADCPDTCYPDTAVAQQTLEYFKRYTTDGSLNSKPFFIAAGLKRPHLGMFASVYILFDVHFDRKYLVS